MEYHIDQSNVDQEYWSRVSTDTQPRMPDPNCQERAHPKEVLYLCDENSSSRLIH